MHASMTIGGSLNPRRAAGGRHLHVRSLLPLRGASHGAGCLGLVKLPGAVHRHCTPIIIPKPRIAASSH